MQPGLEAKTGTDARTPPNRLAPTSQSGEGDGAAGRNLLRVGLLTGGVDRHYSVGLATALMDRGLVLDVIGSDGVNGPEFHQNPRARFFNLYGTRSNSGAWHKLWRVSAFYARLCLYVLTAKPKLFHILWNNKLEIVDRTVLMLFYKLMRKKVVLTAHNVNAGRRDGKDSVVNRATLRYQYALADHIFVHTEKMKYELVSHFSVQASKVTIIPFGINNAVPNSEVTGQEARKRLGLAYGEKVILYFGAIKEYKGLDYLVEAFQRVASDGDYRLIIAGQQKKGHEKYWQSIRQRIDQAPCKEQILKRIEFIPDSEVELYFKAADIAVLPYTEIFQSGVLFMAYSYGLPVIATDVGSFSNDVVEGLTGFICRPRDPTDLAATIQRFFGSDLYRELPARRRVIQDYATSGHSWTTVAGITHGVYSSLLER